jgi:transcriptional regulator GlxA family with amidase domain
VSAARDVALVVFEGAQVLDVAGPLEIFRAANLALDQSRAPAPRYRSRLVARERGPVRTSCGLEIVATNAFQDRLATPDTLIIAGGMVEGALEDAALVRYVASTAKDARRVAAIGTGTFVLAAADLLDGKRATTHWRAGEQLAREHPRIRVEAEALMVTDGKFHTSAGASAALDQALALVQQDHGRDVAMAVAHRKVMFVRRTGGEAQVSAHLAAQMVRNEGLARATSWILAHVATDIDIERLASIAAMSKRNLARVFAKELGMSPARFIERTRLEVARRLLEESDARIDLVARKSGFGSEDRLRRAFHRAFGMSPRDYHHQAAALEEPR